jgi:hypothetical protein
MLWLAIRDFSQYGHTNLRNSAARKQLARLAIQASGRFHGKRLANMCPDVSAILLSSFEQLPFVSATSSEGRPPVRTGGSAE